MCRCAERRRLLLRSAEALARGDLHAAQPVAVAAAVARTAVEDTQAALRAALAKAHARLKR